MSRFIERNKKRNAGKWKKGSHVMIKETEHDRHSKGTVCTVIAITREGTNKVFHCQQLQKGGGGSVRTYFKRNLFLL